MVTVTDVFDIAKTALKAHFAVEEFLAPVGLGLLQI